MFKRAARRAIDAIAARIAGHIRPALSDPAAIDAIAARIASHIRPAFSDLFWDRNSITAGILLDQEIARIRSHIATETPDNPALHGYSVYSQCDEDGIIAHLLSVIESRTPLARTCIELGASNGLENNTHALILSGFRGIWVEGDQQQVDQIAQELGGTTHPRLKLVRQMIDADNLSWLWPSSLEFLGKELDLLSIDLDGNDRYILQKIVPQLQPKVIVIEYNAKFRPPLPLSISYDPLHTWSSDDFYGASLCQLVDDAEGYRLVSCSITGANAFFVRRDFADLFPDYSPEQLYQPLRQHLIFAKSKDHRPSLKFLKTAVSRPPNQATSADDRLPHREESP
jgi:hypothetical protein